ncbi:hypothetical protein LINGRAPRIM_LOCUS814 [Linum grandiflorum]
MIEMVDQKKVDDKGKFMAGAYKEMERLIEEAKPGCGVKWDPYILSRIKTLKMKFLVVQELKGLSGAGWDESRKMVLLDDHVYADYVADPTVGDQQQADGQRVHGDDYINLEDEVPPPTPTEKANQSERDNQSEASSKPKRLFVIEKMLNRSVTRKIICSLCWREPLGQLRQWPVTLNLPTDRGIRYLRRLLKLKVSHR